MKKLVHILVSTAAVLLSTNLLAANTTNKTTNSGPIKPINRIVAVVNQGIVTESELEIAIKSTKAQFAQQGMKLPSEKELRSKILDGLILQKLQLQVAKQNSISVSEDQLDAAITQIAKQNHATIDQLKQKLKSDGLSYDEFRKQIRNQLIIRSLQQQAVVNSIKLTRPEVAVYKAKLEKDNAINDYHIIDYLVPLTAHPTVAQKHAAKIKANMINQKLQQNNPINDSSIKVNDMGFRPLADLPDLFSVPIAKLSQGGVSQPILAGNGYHILKLVAIKKDEKPITDQQAQQLLFQEKFKKALAKWLEDLRKHAYVKIY